MSATMTLNGCHHDTLGATMTLNGCHHDHITSNTTNRTLSIYNKAELIYLDIYSGGSGAYYMGLLQRLIQMYMRPSSSQCVGAVDTEQ